MKIYENLDLKEIPLDQMQGGNTLLQSSFWGIFKSAQGWEARAFRYQWRNHQGQLLILIRRLFRFLPIAYVPFGPDLPLEDKEAFLTSLSWGLISELPLGTLFIRYDINQGIQENALEARSSGSIALQRPCFDKPLIKALQDIQPPDTVILDITATEEAILAGMHKKWRYNIRLASKKGVSLHSSKQPDLEEWYHLYRVTAERDRIALHPQSYYQKIFDLANENKGGPVLRLITARHEQDLLAGIIVSFYGNRATYLYGASSNEKRNLMPAYALQWEAICQARAFGCEEYDFFGIPPGSNENHPMHGLFLFKTGFGGDIHHNYGAWDYPYGKVLYHAYRIIERIRLWYYKSFRKKQR